MNISKTQKLTNECSASSAIGIQKLKEEGIYEINNIKIISDSALKLKDENKTLEAGLLIEKIIAQHPEAHKDVYFKLLMLYKILNYEYAIELAEEMRRFMKNTSDVIKIHKQLSSIYFHKNEHIKGAIHTVLQIIAQASNAKNELREYNKYESCMKQMSHKRVNDISQNSKMKKTDRSKELKSKINRLLDKQTISKSLKRHCSKLGIGSLSVTLSGEISEYVKSAENACELKIEKIITNFIKTNALT